jgi:hypothetical protein
MINMINTLYVTYLFNFFIIFLNKTDGQTLDTKTRVYFFFFWDGGSRSIKIRSSLWSLIDEPAVAPIHPWLQKHVHVGQVGPTGSVSI